MVTLQILVLSFQVRILVAQQGSLSVLRGFCFVSRSSYPTMYNDSCYGLERLLFCIHLTPPLDSNFSDFARLFICIGSVPTAIYFPTERLISRTYPTLLNTHPLFLQQKKGHPLRDNLFIKIEFNSTATINLYCWCYFGAARRRQNRNILNVCEDFVAKADDKRALQERFIKLLR